jgi:hypothetical protein
MLAADIHGHVVPEARDSEDYLTSTVFGHLRYLPPSVFWDRLFAHTLGMPTLPAKSAGSTLAEALIASAVDIAAFEQLEVLFWASHPLFGVPDLILCFTGTGKRALVVLIEAKLWSDKSGAGEFDQIARYVRLLEQPDSLRPRLPRDFTWVLVYLTPRESLAELDEKRCSLYKSRPCTRANFPSAMAGSNHRGAAGASNSDRQFEVNSD